MTVLIRTTFPITGERKEWLNECAPNWCTRRSDEEHENPYASFVKTKFYLELTEKQAVLYRIAFPDTILEK